MCQHIVYSFHDRVHPRYQTEAGYAGERPALADSVPGAFSLRFLTSLMFFSVPPPDSGLQEKQPRPARPGNCKEKPVVSSSSNVSPDRHT